MAISKTRVACVFTGISNCRYMVGLFDCLQYYLLLVDDGLCKRKFVLYFCFVGIFCIFCGPFYYLTRRLIFRLYICITNSHTHSAPLFRPLGAMLSAGELTATVWLPSCDVISARQWSYPVSARQKCTYRVRPLSGGDDITGRQPGCGRDFAR